MVAFRYEFANLCGNAYTGGTLSFTPDGKCLISPVGQRLTVFELTEGRARTLPVVARGDIACTAVSPSGHFLLSVDCDGYVQLINLPRRVVLHRFRLKGGRVRCIAFSPSGEYFAAGVGRAVQVWRTPTGRLPEFAPFVHYKSLTGHADDVTALAWSPSGAYLLSGGRDTAVKLFAVHGGEAVSMSGHRDHVVLTAFGKRARAGASRIGTRDANADGDGGGDGGDHAQSGGDGGEDDDKDAVAYSVGRDGTVITWHFEQQHTTVRCLNRANVHAPLQAQRDRDGGGGMTRSKVLCAAHHRASNVLTVGLSSGVFALFELDASPSPGAPLVPIHFLSASSRSLTAVAVNCTGDWLAVASGPNASLLVWEWPSETHVLKQQGHVLELATLAYSPDGSLIATGGDDGKVKLWGTASGFCSVTFGELHTSGVTALAFAPMSGVLFTASLDGTVRAVDLKRYRAFRTFAAPSPMRQFSSLAVDHSGEMVCAGCRATFEICVWNVRTGRLLELLAGHEAPVVSLCFSPVNSGALASASWDGTVRVWDLYGSGGGDGGGGTPCEELRHSKEVVCVAYHPDGRELVTSTIDGALTIWDTERAEITGSVAARRDAGRYFSSVCYSADGKFLLAGGGDTGDAVCVYSRATQQRVAKYELAEREREQRAARQRRRLHLGGDGGGGGGDDDDNGVRDLDEDSNEYYAGAKRTLESSLPGAKSQRRTERRTRLRGVKFSPTMQTWAAATTSGLLVYAVPGGAGAFDPVDLDVDVTPAAARAATARGEWLLGLRIALRLNERAEMERAIGAVPYAGIDVVACALSPAYLVTLLQFFAQCRLSGASPHIEYDLCWCERLLVHHAPMYREDGASALLSSSSSGAAAAASLAAALLAVQRAVAKYRGTLQRLCEDNKYALAYCCSSSESGGGGGGSDAVRDGDADSPAAPCTTSVNETQRV